MNQTTQLKPAFVGLFAVKGDCLGLEKDNFANDDIMVKAQLNLFCGVGVNSRSFTDCVSVLDWLKTHLGSVLDRCRGQGGP